MKTEPAGALVYLNRKDLGDRGTAPQTLAAFKMFSLGMGGGIKEK